MLLIINMENVFDNDNENDILSEIDINLLDDSKQENYFKDDDDIIFNEIPENLVSVKRKIRGINLTSSPVNYVTKLYSGGRFRVIYGDRTFLMQNLA